MKVLIDLIEKELQSRKRSKSNALIFKARIYQQDIIDLYDKYDYFLLCWCRRMGKDLLALYLACKRCIEVANSVVYYVFPTMKQGKMMILDGYSNNKKKIIDEIIDRKVLDLPLKSDKLYHSDNTIRFKNGSKIYFVGSQDANNKVGGNLDLLVISEMALIQNKDIMMYLIPSVVNIKGKIILVSTPRFGSEFNKMIEEKPQKWFIDVLNALDSRAVEADGTRVYTDEKLENVKSLMSESKFKQDILCDIDVANENAIYAESLLKAEWIKDLNISNKKLYVSEDLGINDSTALVFTVDNTIIHHYANTDRATIHYIEYIKAFMKQANIKDVEIILPHDARNRQDAIDYLTSRREAYNKHFKNVRVLRAYEVNKTIEITRHSIEQHKIKFLDCAAVRDMARLMKAYEWKIDNSTRENLRVPIHGRGLAASNTCDAVEYYCMSMFLEEYEEKMKEFIYQDNYENGDYDFYD
jgi:hypothetical protein|nr:MAG TPA: Large subunit terminase [Caudoviricetes sp.]